LGEAKVGGFSVGFESADSDKPKEECGVVAIRAKKDASTLIYYALRAIQHRGQEAAGIATYTDSLKVKKNIGLVSDAVHPEDMEKLPGKVGIGHTYYSIKVSKPENVQPQFLKTSVGDIAIAHNGIIVNSGQLVTKLKAEGKNFIIESEEEAIIMMLADAIRSTNDIHKSIKSVCKELIGSYAFALMINDRLFAIRDPYGLRPLCLGTLDNGFVAASESVALDVLGAKFVRDVMPGEAVEITEDGFKSINIGAAVNRAHCFFEWVYFARADSIIDGLSVYEVRKRIGWRLAKEAPVVADVVVPIPDSGRAHAYGFAMGSGIKMNEGLMKNRYVHRTFIMPSQAARDISVREKMNPVRAVVEGKRVVIVDDSIVRGTTMTRIVKMLRDAGASEVHVRIGSPPIIAPCYLGIDMTDKKQFIADDKTVEEIRQEIGADTLAYITIDGLVEAITMEKENLCLGCVSCEYPVAIPGERRRFQQTLANFVE
jgi:amidophosphoribosyltransferase